MPVTELLLLFGSWVGPVEPPEPDEPERTAEMEMLEADLRLGKRISMDLKAPTIRQVLRRIEGATGVPLRVGPGINPETARFGVLKALNAQAWEVLLEVGTVEGAEGEWRRDGDGYVLVATNTATVVAKTLQFWLIVSAAVLLAVLMIGLGIWRHRSLKRGSKDEAEAKTTASE